MLKKCVFFFINSTEDTLSIFLEYILRCIEINLSFSAEFEHKSIFLSHVVSKTALFRKLNFKCKCLKKKQILGKDTLETLILGHWKYIKYNLCKKEGKSFYRKYYKPELRSNKGKDIKNKFSSNKP